MTLAEASVAGTTPLTAPGAAAMAWLVLSRLAYAVGIGAALVRQDRVQVFTRDRGIEAGFEYFRSRAALVMNNDAVALALLCLVTRNSLPAAIPRIVLAIVGVVFVMVGGGVKVWARETLGAKAYYWYNFFDPAEMAPLKTPGPYRYLDNPMYTVGYLPAYGLALIFASWPGLIAAAFAQVAILAFHLVVEKPHFDRLQRRRAQSGQTGESG